MKSLDHPNIVKAEGYYEDNDYVIIVMEIMAFDLRNLLLKVDIVIDESLIKDIFYQMLMSVQHCHINGIVHRDIKMENILMDVTPEGGFKVKLTDFGIARICKEGNQLTGRCGSLMNIAPEILAGN